MIKVRRIGHATFETPDLERQIEHFTQVTGLVLAAREKSDKVAKVLIDNPNTDIEKLDVHVMSDVRDVLALALEPAAGQAATAVAA